MEVMVELEFGEVKGQRGIGGGCGGGLYGGGPRSL